ncbi:amino acid ABC transporter permease [Paludibacterium paludis]|uniref:ABC transporter permease n=1 Tax=Paludibacterium paludis TaxID=1225769 RepID=A0A918NYY7_9NEIS|nr:amino acid ABC transporter permease [Paludibacterium paludis]GGY06424.1 ABC transporter permease [Paludibacterium paludis]
MMLSLIRDNLDFFLLGSGPGPGGFVLTLLMSLAAGLAASVLGLAGGIALTVGGRSVVMALEAATAVLRAIPVVMLIFWCYFLLPVVFGIDVPGIATVIAALALISGAYLAQSVRAGIAAIGRGQWEAGRSLGLGTRKVLTLIILPQALRVMLPSFVNQWVTLVKDTSLAYVVGVAELTFVATQVNNREQVYPLEIFAFIGLMYFLLCSSLSLLGRLAGRKWPVRAA